jgi:hypothetical protein
MFADVFLQGAAAALKRASAKAIERARHAGLEPVIFQPSDGVTAAVLREDPAPYGKPPGETPRTAP